MRALRITYFALILILSSCVGKGTKIEFKEIGLTVISDPTIIQLDNKQLEQCQQIVHPLISDECAGVAYISQTNFIKFDLENKTHKFNIPAEEKNFFKRFLHSGSTIEAQVTYTDKFLAEEEFKKYYETPSKLSSESDYKNALSAYTQTIKKAKIYYLSSGAAAGFAPLYSSIDTLRMGIANDFCAGKTETAIVVILPEFASTEPSPSEVAEVLQSFDEIKQQVANSSSTATSSKDKATLNSVNDLVKELEINVTELKGLNNSDPAFNALLTTINKLIDTIRIMIAQIGSGVREVADSDKDGLIDSKDNCPYVYGPISNNGCPKGPGPDCSNLPNPNSLESYFAEISSSKWLYDCKFRWKGEVVKQYFLNGEVPVIIKTGDTETGTFPIQIFLDMMAQSNRKATILDSEKSNGRIISITVRYN